MFSNKLNNRNITTRKPKILILICVCQVNHSVFQSRKIRYFLFILSGQDPAVISTTEPSLVLASGSNGVPADGNTKSATRYTTQLPVEVPITKNSDPVETVNTKNNVNSAASPNTNSSLVNDSVSSSSKLPNRTESSTIRGAPGSSSNEGATVAINNSDSITKQTERTVSEAANIINGASTASALVPNTNNNSTQGDSKGGTTSSEQQSIGALYTSTSSIDIKLSTSGSSPSLTSQSPVLLKRTETVTRSTLELKHNVTTSHLQDMPSRTTSDFHGTDVMTETYVDSMDATTHFLFLPIAQQPYGSAAGLIWIEALI